MTTDELISILQRSGVVQLRIANGNIRGCCPFHAETRPSWGISVNPPHLHACFSCGAKGSVVGLMKHAGVFTPQEIRKASLDREDGLTLPNWSPVGQRRFTLEENLIYPYVLTSVARSYLRHRGLTDRTIRLSGCVFHEDTSRVLFPWYINTTLVGVTGRSIDPTEPAKTLPFFGTKKGQAFYLPSRSISKREPFIIVEGEIDALKVFQAGFPNVGALGFGKFTHAQERMLLDCGVSAVVVFTDFDSTGLLLRKEIVSRLTKRRLRADSVTYENFSAKVKVDPGALTRSQLVDTLASVRKFDSWPEF